tara:strand:- start:450 stop:818 length:369 start_codon:yes stop_codon:yes gene_type:complete
MKTLQEENIEELTKKVYKLINVTSISLGFKTDGETMAAQAKILSQDLQKENRFKRMYFTQIQDSFYIGLRFCDFEPYLNIRTFYKWIIAHKKTVNDAYYQVHTLNKKPEEVPFYQEPKKLLK